MAEVIKGNGKLINQAVKLWIEQYEMDSKSAMVELLTMLFEVIWIFLEITLIDCEMRVIYFIFNCSGANIGLILKSLKNSSRFAFHSLVGMSHACTRKQKLIRLALFYCLL